MAKRLIGLCNQRHLLRSHNGLLNFGTIQRLNSTKDQEEKVSLEKIDQKQEKLLQKYMKKVRFRGKEQEKEEERKGPFKNYFEDEERNKKSIMYYEEFFDKTTQQKDRENFMNAIEVFRVTNPSKQLYIDFIYGALLKMKEYNAHTHLEAYRKLMELFPIGPLRSLTAWQRENMHYPRHQNCALQILEQMERNGVILDEDFTRLAIQIFGDWTHVVRKAKRQLYWLPKFKNSNPYPLPSLEKLENMKDIDIAVAALERMCMSADYDTRISTNFTDELKGSDKSEENTWIVTAQSQKQVELLLDHKRSVPIFVDGPYFTWIRNKKVEYYLMKTDPMPETLDKIKRTEDNENNENFNNLYNMFDDPFKKNQSNKKPELSVHEMADGNIFAMCCTGTGTKTSLYSWTKILEKRLSFLKEFLIVYRMKPKTNEVVDINRLNSENKKSE